MNTLAIDIGNTTVSCGLFAGQRMKKRFDLPSRTGMPLHWYERRIRKNVPRSHPVQAVIACSVVPGLNCAVKKACRSLFGLTPAFTGMDVMVPVRNLARNREQVGQDRLVNAFAACRIYGAPAIVVDSGTAVTVDVISSKGEYLGGAIMPGIRLSLDALSERTALLPKLNGPGKFGLIGRDTAEAMSLGVVKGLAGAVDRIVSDIRGKMPCPRVIGTGGNIRTLRKYSRTVTTIDPDLTLKGLNLLAKFSS